jgi:hypothetical protein
LHNLFEGNTGAGDHVRNGIDAIQLLDTLPELEDQVIIHGRGHFYHNGLQRPALSSWTFFLIEDIAEKAVGRYRKEISLNGFIGFETVNPFSS